ncbi:MAG: hypothetical protein AAFX05_07675 [Planctomycetota bacterium]
MTDRRPRPCVHCGYDVSTTLEARITTCPECGGLVSFETCPPVPGRRPFFPRLPRTKRGRVAAASLILLPCLAAIITQAVTRTLSLATNQAASLLAFVILLGVAWLYGLAYWRLRDDWEGMAWFFAIPVTFVMAVLNLVAAMVPVAIVNTAIP